MGMLDRSLDPNAMGVLDVAREELGGEVPFLSVDCLAAFASMSLRNWSLFIAAEEVWCLLRFREDGYS